MEVSEGAHRNWVPSYISNMLERDAPFPPVNDLLSPAHSGAIVHQIWVMSDHDHPDSGRLMAGCYASESDAD